MSKAKMLAVSVLALALVSPVLPHSRLIVSAQEMQQPSSSPAPAAETPKPPHSGQRSSEGALIVKEEEGEASPTAAFRHSAAVRMVARLTRLDIEKAYWLCMVLNFVSVFVVLWFLLRKSLPAMFRNRTEAIQRRLEEARKAGKEARQRLAEVEARLSRLDVEIEQMRREAEDAGRHEEERVMAAAEEERRRIVESAEQEIARAASAARRELKAYAAELGVSLAEKKIRVAENMDHKLVQDFAAQLGKDGNN